MYGIGILRSRLKLCRSALCISRFSPLFENSQKAIGYVSEKSVPNLGFCTNHFLSENFPSFQSATDPSSYSACAGSVASSPESDNELIWAVMRRGKGKRFAENERTNAMIPGFVFDLLSTAEKDHMLVSMDKFQIQSLWSRMGEEKLLVTVFTMEIFDEWGSQNLIHKLPVLPRRINYDKCGNICNMGFAKALPGTKMRLDTSIHIFGEEGCIGVKKGGYLVVHLKYVSLYCSAEEIYPSVKVDITMMDIGDKVYLRDLDFKVPLHSSNEPSLVVCEVVAVQPSSSELLVKRYDV
ncbi:hypothetical protein L7F22_050434 [Adiantum nelumboides]|nr:hypothetical protein [Adiantum nelumboides]